MYLDEKTKKAYTVQEIKMETERAGYELIYECVLSVIQFSMILGCLYGFLTLLGRVY